MKKILVIGAGFLQTFVIRKAKELGYCVITVDGNPNAEGYFFADEHKTIDIVNERMCLEYAKEKNIDGVMTAATDFGVLTAAYIAREMKLPGLDYECAQTVKNKYLVRKKLYENQVDDTEQSYEVNAYTDIKVLQERIQYPVMVKPCDSSGSRGASKVSSADDLRMACEFAIKNSITHKAEIETFIVGQEYGVESLVENGKIHVLAVMKKWMTNPPYYAELGHAIPSGLSPEIEQKIRCCVKKAIHALGINFGAVNMDVLITQENKVHIIDVGARMGGNLIGSHIIHLGTGIDYLCNLIKAAVDDPISMNPTSDGRYVVTRLLSLSPGKIKSLPNLKRIEKDYNVEIQHHLEIGETINEYHTNLDGCGYVIAVSDQIENAITNAENAKKAIDCGIERG